ncbi:cytochrome P450 72A397 [Daucus carota subsp. sativus]|uniref:cytochrome P450 72A397 n=1 Tax=Daucus carota subsp. sativus TaxID=79200 RepID=UPI0007EFD43C|nr:PREDICTED: cytochrome P450 72A15-like [Daucus carota subsp. sativus]
MDASTIASIIISVISVFILSFTIKLAKKFWLRPKKVEKRLREIGFKGNSYRFFYGDAKEMEQMRIRVLSKPIDLSSDDIASRVLPYHHYLAQKYGKQFFIWIGTKPRLTVMDPVLVKEILARPDEFQKPRNDHMAHVMVGGLFTTEGNIWSKHKKIINPTFHMDKIKKMVPLIVKSSLDMMDKWNMLLSASKKSVEIDLWEDIQPLTYDIMCKTLVVGETNEEITRIHELRDQINEQAAKVGKLMFFPGWWNLPTKDLNTLKSVHKQVEGLVKKVVTKRLEEMKRGASSEGDMLGLMLEAYLDKTGGFSLDDVMDECRSFHFAGTEVTARSLIWVLYVLSKYPEWQAKAREEVLQVFGDQNPNAEGLNQLKIVTMILYEVMRLYPPTSMIHRAISKDTKLGDMILPAWVQMTIPITLMNHDPDIWGEDVHEFKPERFEEGVFNSKMQSVYFAFASGPRKCIGQSMAMVTDKFVVATLLQRFSFEISPSYEHAPKHAFLLVPQHGMKLVVRKLI